MVDSLIDQDPDSPDMLSSDAQLYTAFSNVFVTDREALKKQGIKFITPSQEQMNEWMATAAQTSQEMINAGELPKASTNKVDDLLEQYRKNQQLDHKE